MAYYYWNQRNLKQLKRQKKRLERQIEIEEALERKAAQKKLKNLADNKTLTPEQAEQWLEDWEQEKPF